MGLIEHPLLLQLENRGLLSAAGPNEAEIGKLSLRDIEEIGEEAAVLTSAATMPRERTQFVHSAAGSLGAGRSPCSGIACRTDRARELAEFAIVYSDRVYISNFLAQHRVDDSKTSDVARTRARIRDDLIILHELRSLIAGGRVVPVTFPAVHCPQCLVFDALGEEADRKLTIGLRALERRFAKEAQVELTLNRDGLRAVLSGPEDLLEHGEVGFRFRTLPKRLLPFTSVLARLRRGERVVLGTKAAAALKMHHPVMRSLLNDISFDLLSTQSLGTSFVTERAVHVQMLQQMSSNAEQVRRNQLVETHLSTIIPFLSDVATEDLLALRMREEEAFILFRHRLDEAIREAVSAKGRFEENDARALYGDVLAPGLARLDQRVRASKKASKASLRRSGLATVGALSFGSFTELLPSTLIGAAKALGLTGIAKDLSERAMNASAADELVREDELYFLWKVRALRDVDEDPLQAPAL